MYARTVTSFPRGTRSTRGDVGLAGAHRESGSLHADLELVGLAVEFLRDEAEQVLVMEFVGNPGERRREVVGGRKLEVAATARLRQHLESRIRLVFSAALPAAPPANPPAARAAASPTPERQLSREADRVDHDVLLPCSADE